jgi:hypothetical protein
MRNAAKASTYAVTDHWTVASGASKDESMLGRATAITVSSNSVTAVTMHIATRIVHARSPASVSTCARSPPPTMAANLTDVGCESTSASACCSPRKVGREALLQRTCGNGLAEVGVERSAVQRPFSGA